MKAGENRGRSLEHDFVVLDMKTERMQAGDGNALITSVPLPKDEYNAPRLGLAVWISYADDNRPLQATGGWLSASN